MYNSKFVTATKQVRPQHATVMIYTRNSSTTHFNQVVTYTYTSIPSNDDGKIRHEVYLTVSHGVNNIANQ